MRTRTHEIKLRLDDAEYTRLNEMVSRTIYSREQFLRQMLAGYTVRESPKDYIRFRMEVCRQLAEIRDLLRRTPMTDADRAALRRMADEMVAALKRMDNGHMPSFKG